MRELWGVCRERGIEIEGEIAAVEGGAGVDAVQETVEAEAEASAPASSGNDVPVGNEHQARGDDAVESTPAAESVSPPAPASVPVAQPQPQAPLSTVQAPAAAVMPTRTSSSHLASTESPCEGVWLDRAIIVVIVALVLLILRRVANIDDL
jgi:ubiquitin-conjugating enzyme E2 J1